ncbi:hypothetical protein C2G38_2199871 [Gigaspora rosea]|uniref:Uncharacterized protein n=1 Tax=Gigaspora rosea TaxID=44941 RepID=A0A397UU91_9GLOM|nr:hypothetical protein C2G38_2199871 [Gigaspora rosea]
MIWPQGSTTIVTQANPLDQALRERQEDKYSLDYEDENNYYPDESGYYHLEHIEETENREFTDLAEALERSLETFTE